MRHEVRRDGAQAAEIDDENGQDRAELLARRAYLVSRITAPGFGLQAFPAVLGAQFQGEWALVSLLNKLDGDRGHVGYLDT